MNWNFCPHCETQLDEATGICPACRYDPHEAPPPAPVDAATSLTERYRGTEYDSQLALAPAMIERRRGPASIAKAKLFLVGGVLVLFALYGGMWAYVQIRDADHAPAAVTMSVP